MSSRTSLPKDRYLAALYRQRDRIIAGAEFTAVDSDVIGDKYTHASWGLCSRDKEAWPDAQDHLWPDQFEKYGRVAPKHRTEQQACPMQTKGGGSGCFYSCRIFKSGEITANKRPETIALYEAAIGRARASLSPAAVMSTSPGDHRNHVGPAFSASSGTDTVRVEDLK